MALRQGHRTLVGGSSLARLLETRRGVRNPQNQPGLTEGQIAQWTERHHEATGQWPKYNSGSVMDVPGETWQNIDSALRVGLRSLGGGSSLSALLKATFGVRNLHNQPELTEEQILCWAKAHKEREGKWPRKGSGGIPEAPAETWARIDTSLIVGCRGLRGGSSLAKLLSGKFQVRNVRHVPSLTIDEILSWADSHKKRTGEWPTLKSGSLVEAPGETWLGIDSALRSGSRGLSQVSSLAKLLDEKRGVQNIQNLAPLTEDQILFWAEAHKERTGRWPTHKSGVIYGASGESWRRVDDALRQGYRELPGGSSLAKLLQVKHGVKNVQNQQPLTTERILEWIDEHEMRTGKWPNRMSGAIHNAPGEIWRNVDNALRYGLREFSGGSSLARLIHEHRKTKEPARDAASK